MEPTEQEIEHAVMAHVYGRAVDDHLDILEVDLDDWKRRLAVKYAAACTGMARYSEQGIKSRARTQRFRNGRDARKWERLQYEERAEKVAHKDRIQAAIMEVKQLIKVAKSERNAYHGHQLHTARKTLKWAWRRFRDHGDLEGMDHIERHADKIGLLLDDGQEER